MSNPNKPKFTPGPWAFHYGERSEFNLGRVEKTAKTFVICTDTSGLPIAETLLGTPSANARLIAAAPELLEALRRLISNIQSNDTIALRTVSLREAISAITKATGGAK